MTANKSFDYKKQSVNSSRNVTKIEEGFSCSKTTTVVYMIRWDSLRYLKICNYTNKFNI